LTGGKWKEVLLDEHIIAAYQIDVANVSFHQGCSNIVENNMIYRKFANLPHCSNPQKDAKGVPACSSTIYVLYFIFHIFPGLPLFDIFGGLLIFDHGFHMAL
jgi:hypothetical protein